MARKTTATPAASKAPAQQQPAARPLPRNASNAGTATDSNRLLREAAWSRMFGRTESKNPFTR